MSAEGNIYKFGDFELNPSESLLLRAGQVVSITPKALSLLNLLTVNQGHVLDKAFLLDQVWADSFVEEGSLTFNIRQLRKILGDEVKNPKFIETVPKRGYRFIGKVEMVTPSDRNVSAPPAAVPISVVAQSKKPRRSLWKPWILAIPLILGAGGVAVVESWIGIFDRDNTVPELLTNEFSSERLSTDGNVRHVALSRSGDFMVYVAGNQDEKESLRIRDLTTGQSREFIGSSEERYIGLEISHDDSSVYFVRISAANTATACLFRMKLIGGIPESLVCSIQGWFDISNDGKNISYVRCSYSVEDYCSLFVSDENFKDERLLVTRAKPIRITDNAISPDGRSVAFTAGQSIDGSADFGIYKIDLDTNLETPVVDDKFFNIIGLDWMPDGNSLLATALRLADDSIGFWNVDLRTKTATPMRQGHDTFKSISIDRAGSKLVSTIRNADFKVYVHQMDQATNPITVGNGWTTQFSPDGRILFASDRSGKIAIWSTDPDGTDVKHLSSGSDDFPLASADGSTIYFTSRRSGRIEVWKMQPDGSGAEQLTRKEGGFPVGVSSDGFWIYYLSAMNRSLHRVSNDGMTEEQVANFPMYRAVISPDSGFAAFFDTQSNASAISLFSLESNQRIGSIPFPHSGLEGKHLAWSRSGESIYALLFDVANRSNSVWRLSVDGSRAVKIRDLNVQELGERSSFSVSPDERHFAVTMGQWKHDAVLVHGLK